MLVDFLVILLLLGFVIWGFVHGAVVGILGLVALVLAYFLSALGAGPLAALLVAKLAWSPGIAYLAARAALCAVIYLPLTIFVSKADRRFREARNDTLLGINAGVGGAIALAWGVLAAFLLLCVADVWAKAAPDAKGFFIGSVRASYFREMVSPSNPADRFLITDSLRLLRAARQDPEVLKRLSSYPQVHEMLEHPAMRKILEDEQFAQKLREEPLRTILHDETLGALLADKELRGLILSVEMRDALRQAVEEPPPAASP